MMETCFSWWGDDTQRSTGVPPWWRPNGDQTFSNLARLWNSRHSQTTSTSRYCGCDYLVI